MDFNLSALSGSWRNLANPYFYLPKKKKDFLSIKLQLKLSQNSSFNRSSNSRIVVRITCLINALNLMAFKSLNNYLLLSSIFNLLNLNFDTHYKLDLDYYFRRLILLFVWLAQRPKYYNVYP